MHTLNHIKTSTREEIIRILLEQRQENTTLKRIIKDVENVNKENKKLIQQLRHDTNIYMEP